MSEGWRPRGVSRLVGDWSASVSRSAKRRDGASVHDEGHREGGASFSTPCDALRPERLLILDDQFRSLARWGGRRRATEGGGAEGLDAGIGILVRRQLDAAVRPRS